MNHKSQAAHQICPDNHIWMDFWHGTSSWEMHMHFQLIIIQVNSVRVSSVNLYLDGIKERLITTAVWDCSWRVTVWDWLLTRVPCFTCTPCGYRGTESFTSESWGFSVRDPQATSWSWKQESLEWSAECKDCRWVCLSKHGYKKLRSWFGELQGVWEKGANIFTNAF